MREGGGARARPRQRVPESRARVELDLETAYAGGMQRLGIDGRTLEVRIPQGILPGQQIRLRGQGEGGGDLLLEVAYRPHARYAMEGKDLLLRRPLAPWEAANGASVEVPTLGGAVELRIPAGTGSGKRLRLRGRGMPGNPPGDQFVIVEVQAPEPKSDAQREADARLAEAFPDFAPRKG
jgi:curved DNA-binding protein